VRRPQALRISPVELKRRPIALAWCLFFALGGFVAGLDLWTKKAVFEALEVESREVWIPAIQDHRPQVVSQRVIEVIPGFFELEANYNYGAFSGWFSRHTGWLTVLSCVALVVIPLFLWNALRRAERPGLWFAAALGLIWGGTLGNLYDRATLSAVRDWIKWFYVSGLPGQPREHVWPNFNIADSGICAGVALIVLLEVAAALRERRRAREDASPAIRQ
jgi:signal peptidase II